MYELELMALRAEVAALKAENAALKWEASKNDVDRFIERKLEPCSGSDVSYTDFWQAFNDERWTKEKVKDVLRRHLSKYSHDGQRGLFILGYRWKRRDPQVS